MARSDLVQANIDRARATSASVKSPTATTAADAAKAKENKEGAKKETKKGPRVSDHRSILGANLAILQTLASIEFAPGNDGGMYKTTAYIELWKRGGTGNTQQETQVDGGVETPLTYADLGILDEARDDDEEDFFNSPTDPATGAPERVEKLFGDSSTVPSTAATEANKAKQEALKEGTPTTAPAGDTPNTTTGTPVDPKAKPAPTKGVAGPIKPANPGGGIGGFFRKALGGGGKIGYGGNLTQTVNGSGRIGDFCTEKPQGVWQFLFNPEEIDWEGGPEYDEAQTWGVMGKTNSGKPLFWKNMKNERLTFSKVLLNGYVFGKQVGSLEEGLKDLFYKEEGDNPAGPPVLNLIWGERTFGPCVIQDVRVKEKNWDNGILVNAEVSFSLVKIPEWIVNDGYVDVARPSAQPVNGDVFAAPGKADAPADPGGGGDTPPGGDKPGPQAGAKANPKLANEDLVRKCNKAAEKITQLTSISSLILNPNSTTYENNTEAGIDLVFNRNNIPIKSLVSNYISVLAQIDGATYPQFNEYLQKYSERKRNSYTSTGVYKHYDSFPNLTDLAGAAYLRDACIASIQAIRDSGKVLGCTSTKLQPQTRSSSTPTPNYGGTSNPSTR